MTRLEEVQQEAAYYLDKIKANFRPLAKLTLLVRQPEHPDGSRDFILSDDVLTAAIAALKLRLPAPPKSCDMPTVPGFYWAKWRIADEGTAEGDELTPSDKWEPVELAVNAIDRNHPEYLKVYVQGVTMTQSPENFVWGPAIEGMPA